MQWGGGAVVDVERSGEEGGKVSIGQSLQDLVILYRSEK